MEHTLKVMAEYIKDKWLGIVSALIIGFLSGVGTFQLLIAGEVKAHEIKIINLKEQFQESSQMHEKRMDNVVKLLESQSNQNTAVMQAQAELISLVKQSVLLQTQQGRINRGQQ